MANRIKYCRKCGTATDSDSNFCVNCGARIEQFSSDNAPVNNTDSNNTGELMEKKAAEEKVIEKSAASQGEQTNKKSKKKTGRVIAILLIIAIFCETAFWHPGFLCKKNRHSGSEALASGQLKSDYKSELVTEGTLTMEDATIEKGDVKVTVEDGFLLHDRNITVKHVTEEVNYSFDGEVEVPLTIYEVEIDGIHDGSMITLELPMDKDAAPEYRAGYIDEDTGELAPCTSEYNPDSGILTIHTSHLSRFCGIPIKNEKTAKATLAYVSGYEFLDDSMGGDYQTLISLFGTTIESGNNVECGMSVLDKLSFVQGGAGVMNDLAGVPASNAVSTIAEGSATSIYFGGNQGTIGEIMNTNWGRSGAMQGSTNFGKTATRIVGYDDQLKAVYPAKTIDKISKGLTNAGRILCLIKLTNCMIEDGFKAKSTASEAYKWAAGEMLGYYTRNSTYTAGLGVYMIGVSAFGLMLDYVYSEALNGRKEAYVHAYTRYYSKNAHRTDDDWINEFKKIMDNGGTFEDFQAEIDRYVNEFWKKADETDTNYLSSILTDDDRHAWGIEAQAGLTPEIKKEISDNYKARLYKKRMPEIFAKLEQLNRLELCEKYQAEVDSLRKQMNQKISLQITSDIEEEEEGKSKYAGCTIRFKGMQNKVSNPKEWETVLDIEGCGTITFTFLSHMITNAGTELEIVKTKDGEEEVIRKVSFDFKENYGSLDAYCRIPGSLEEEELEEETDTEGLGFETEMTINNMWETTQYTNPAYFSIDEKGKFSISIDEQYIDSFVASDSGSIRVESKDVRYGKIHFEGDFADAKVSTSNGGTMVQTKNIKMPDSVEDSCTNITTALYMDPPYEMDHINVVSVITQVDSISDPREGQDNYWYMTMNIIPNDNGGTLKIYINSVLKVDATSNSGKDYQTSYMILPAELSCELDSSAVDKLLKAYK